MIGWLMNDELKIIWNDLDLAYSRYHFCICLEAPRKTTKKLSQDSMCPHKIRTEDLLNTNLEQSAQRVVK
jgi:hypothetical protein